MADFVLLPVSECSPGDVVKRNPQDTLTYNVVLGNGVERIWLTPNSSLWPPVLVSPDRLVYRLEDEKKVSSGH